MDLLSDNYLMLKVKEGDLDKMGLLFERHHKVLFGFLYQMSGQRSTAEDLVQTAFYRMLKYKHTFNGVGEFKTWMFHIARNVLYDASKKNKRMEYRSDVIQLGGSREEDAADHSIIKKQEATGIHRAMQNMTPKHKEVLLLSKFQELPYKEIATILETTEGNIKARVHRAMKELKNIYLNQEHEARI